MRFGVFPIANQRDALADCARTSARDASAGNIASAGDTTASAGSNASAGDTNASAGNINASAGNTNSRPASTTVRANFSDNVE